MKWLALPVLFLAGPVCAQDRPAFPTRTAAADAYDAYRNDICVALIDACEGGYRANPEDAQKLTCRSGGRDVALCRFTYGRYKCQARFVRSAEAADGWRVSREDRALRRAQISCDYD